MAGQVSIDGLYSYGLFGYGLYSYGLFGYGGHSHCLCSHGLHGYGMQMAGQVSVDGLREGLHNATSERRIFFSLFIRDSSRLAADISANAIPPRASPPGSISAPPRHHLGAAGSHRAGVGAPERPSFWGHRRAHAPCAMEVVPAAMPR